MRDPTGAISLGPGASCQGPIVMCLHPIDPEENPTAARRHRELGCICLGAGHLTAKARNMRPVFSLGRGGLVSHTRGVRQLRLARLGLTGRLEKIK